ncbi:hypothetical protein N9Y69_02265 [Amylibacter sp.]|nr:hypothetical protein [Amylibacter sp.]
MIIYGLETCSLCQRAKKTLEDNGKSISFRDIRSNPLNDVELNELINEFGDRLVDRKSNDYRSLNVWLKNSEVDAQISSQPKVMARPIIRNKNNFYIGWDDEIKSQLLSF